MQQFKGKPEKKRSMYRIMYRRKEERRGIIWWKIGAWTMKEVRRNNDRTGCLVWSKE
jgi:hypothetical protein